MLLYLFCSNPDKFSFRNTSCLTKLDRKTIIKVFFQFVGGSPNLFHNYNYIGLVRIRLHQGLSEVSFCTCYSNEYVFVSNDLLFRESIPTKYVTLTGDLENQGHMILQVILPSSVTIHARAVED